MILENVALYWAKLNPERPDKGFDGNTPQWVVDIRTRDKAQAAEWKKVGMNVKTDDDDDGVFYKVAVKKPAFNKSGAPNKPVPVVGRDLQPLEDVDSIGNGTIANVALHTFEYNFNGREGVGFRLNGVQVVDLKEYKRSASGENALGFKTLGDVEAVDADADPFA